jgi:hypothetical protein
MVDWKQRYLVASMAKHRATQSLGPRPEASEKTCPNDHHCGHDNDKEDPKLILARSETTTLGKHTRDDRDRDR